MKIHVRFRPLLACLFLAAFLAAVPCALCETLTCIVADGQYVNVRNQASSSAATWGVLHHGDTIEANPLEITRGFFKTEFEGRVAFVSVKFFEIPVEQDFIVAANGRVRMRRSPGGEATGFIQPGRQVHVTAWRYAADGSRWGKCTGGSYIAAQYLEPVQ